MANKRPSQDDPFDSASDPKLAPREYYGEVSVDCWYCALVKGQGKVPYDPAQHERRATAIDISVQPLAEQGVTFALTRSMIAESREWAAIVWPSAKELGVASVRELEGRWAKVTQVPTGRKYTNKQGETKEATTLKFLALYADEAACRAACIAETNAKPSPSGVGHIPGFEDDGAPDPTDSKERETATQFLNVFIQQHSGDKAKIWQAIQSMPMITKFYGEDDLDAAIAAVFQAES